MIYVFAQEDREMVTGTIYVNNNFTFYINGELIAKDPVEIVPHNAYNVTFTIPRNQDVTYAITGIDPYYVIHHDVATSICEVETRYL